MSIYNRPEYLESESDFVEKIEKDSNICNNCFRKIREHTESMHEIATPITEYEDHAEFDYFDDFKFSGRANIKKAYCKCGSVDWNEARIRPLTEERVQNIAKRLVSHLEEKEFDVERKDFIAYILENTRKPDYQYKEEKAFEEATEKYATKRKDE